MHAAWLIGPLATASGTTGPSPPPALPAIQCRPDVSCLFISEYFEADETSKNTFIELYNGCNEAIALSDYQIVLCPNGCQESTSAVTAKPTRGHRTLILPENRHVASRSCWTLVYCEKRLTANCAEDALIVPSRADATIPDLGDGNDYLALYSKLGGQARPHPLCVMRLPPNKSDPLILHNSVHPSSRPGCGRHRPGRQQPWLWVDCRRHARSYPRPSHTAEGPSLARQLWQLGALRG